MIIKTKMSTSDIYGVLVGINNRNAETAEEGLTEVTKMIKILLDIHRDILSEIKPKE